MVGNDIIDIDETRRSTVWERARFIDKVFTKKEQQFISASVDPFQTVWQLWSMKESAYKVYIQVGGDRFFSPTKLDCTIETADRGQVRINKTTLKTNTKFNANYIFTEAVLNREEVESRIFQLTDNSSKAQSMMMQEKVLNAFAEKNSFNRAELEIRKTIAGVPKLYFRKKAHNISFSISHHGNYGAFSFFRNYTL